MLGKCMHRWFKCDNLVFENAYLYGDAWGGSDMAGSLSGYSCRMYDDGGGTSCVVPIRQVCLECSTCQVSGMLYVAGRQLAGAGLDLGRSLAPISITTNTAHYREFFITLQRL